MITIWGREYDIHGLNRYMFLVNEIEHDVYDARHVEFSRHDIVLDIGAHIGLFCIPLAKTNPEVTIYAFEPIPETYALLKRNIEANNCPNIIPICAAVGGWDTELVMQHDANTSYASSAFYTHKIGSKREVLAPCLGINTVFEKYAPAGCKFLKMDCEGAEWDIIRECKYLESVGHLGMELHMLGQNDEEKKRLMGKIGAGIDRPVWNVSIHEVNKEIAEGINKV